MKILIYAVTNFNHGAIDCINMLFGNIKKHEDVDYLVISNNDKPVNFNYPTIKAHLDYNYIGMLKFASEIPSGYDYYIYLDSDILCFGSPYDLVSIDKEVSIVEESGPISNEWFSFHISDKSSLPNIKGINAGTFCFKDYEFLNKVRENIKKYSKPHYSANENSRLEQSVFNFTVGELYGFNWNDERIKNLTSSTKLHVPDNFKYNKDIKVYHFCGWTGEMASKTTRMNRFIQNNLNIFNTSTDVHINIREEIPNILINNSVGCELGVLNGEYSKILFNSGKFSKLYLVDLFSGNVSSGDKNGNNVRNYNGEENYNEVTRTFCNNSNVVVIKSDSLQFLAAREDNYFDFIYIDTGHTYELTVAELALSNKKVKSNGYICGHDYSPTSFPGVYRAVNEFIANTKYELLTTTDDKLASFVIKRK